MNKVLVIGIDSMDSDLLNKYIDFMPNFQKIKAKSPDIKMKSVFPPDSDTAWATIYTGLNPAKHGVVKFVDPMEKSIDIQTKESEQDYIKGKTFWDYASKKGKKVVVLLPHIAYPPWEVNGIMISRSRIKDHVLSFPEQFNEYDINQLNTSKGVPKKDEKSLKNFIESYKNLLISEKNFFLEMMNTNEWDLFFCYSSALDAIQHYFWNFCDENSPDYDINNPFKEIIKEFYILYDSMVGELISTAGDVNTIILSDHGHQGRPQKLVNINEILRQKGFLKSSKNSFQNKGIEKFKSKSIEWVSKFNIGWIASKILKIYPNLIKYYLSNRSLDLSSSDAYVTDLSGIKAYTYGGINIRPSENYDDIRENIIQAIKEELDDKIVFIAKREELYSGQYISKYPDILIQLKDGYGLGNKIKVPIITDAHSSNIVPGSHSRETPVFLIKNFGISNNKINLEDITSMLLELLEIKDEYLRDGNSILRCVGAII